MAVDPSLLYPSIAGQPGGTPITREPTQAPEPRKPVEGFEQGKTSGVAFDQSLRQQIAARGAAEMQQAARTANLSVPGLSSSAIQNPLKFSAHATARLQSRGIEMGSDQMRKLGEAVDKAAAKGLDDTLILTKDAAFIVSVKNRTVVTAMDKTQLEGNVFTNIEGAVIVT